MFSLKSLKGIANRPEQTQIALGVVALVAFVFGIWQINTYIRLPFNLKTSTTDTNGETVQLGDDVLALQKKDSDNDGLTDYDELYLYSTSPYLADTDSDGYSDKTEVDSGNNPNCAPNTTCGPTILTPSTTEPATTATPTADEIRALLRQAGVSDDEIAKYDDSALISIYQQVSGEMINEKNPSIDNGNTSTDNFVLTPEQKELIKKMNSQELRQFLINGGADSAMINKIDDNTLRALINEQLGI